MLKDPNIAEQFKAQIDGIFAPLLLISDANEQTDQFKEVMNQAAATVIGKKKTAKKPWITTEMLHKCKKSRKLKEKRNINDEFVAYHALSGESSIHDGVNHPELTGMSRDMAE